MALPSTRRPTIVEEEIEEKATASLKIKIDKKAIFMKSMIAWYMFDLNSDRLRDTLTPKKLKRKAVAELYKLGYEYNRLPLDWVQQLSDATGMKLYQKKKKNMDIDEVVAVKVDPLALAPGIQVQQDEKMEVDEDDDIDKEEGAGEMEEKEPLEPRKPLIDLSDEPPPPEWLQAYANGVHLRRDLTIYNGPDKTVIFYDYSPKYNEEEIVNKTRPQVHDANSFDWFRARIAQLEGREEESDEEV